MRLSPTAVKKVIHTLASSNLPKDATFSEPVLAAYLVYQDCQGDNSADGCPIAKFLRKTGIPNPRVYNDRLSWGFCWPFGRSLDGGRPYIIHWTMPLPPRLVSFQKNAYHYPLLYDPSTDRSIRKRLSFVISALGPNKKTIEVTGEMIIRAIKKGELAKGGDLALEIDPSMFDSIHVNNLLQSLADTPQPKDV